ncbi:hypothetical protein CHS0354_033124 [Potamilus streckersoni]|uniref:Caspase family p20 domain-containing protein n=1 Tax=Potamilus streckersoni TaxID=2493646 RepID=A0AAE0VR00_9BIVA|nr:hypothetical protein CHS0354_033124 [Potamilus streckersoni]
MEENVYIFSHKHRGLALVIVNNKFNVPHLLDRSGAENDLKNMKKLFTKLAFAVKIYENLGVEQMIKTLKKAASNKKFLKDSDYFVCVISTHGEEIKDTTLASKQTTVQHDLYGIDGMPIYTSDVTTLFNMSNCPALAGKPKLFFIQVGIG